MHKQQTHEHIVPIEGFKDYGDWFDIHQSIVGPWLKEHTTGRWCASFSKSHFTNAGIATYEFSDLQDAALFRLRF